FPDLDLASFENLVAALGSPDDAEALAAMELLSDAGRGRLVPSLILYHPSESIVMRALRLFADTGNTETIGVIDRLLDHPSANVRAGAFVARSRLAPDDGLLQSRYSSETDDAVRAVIAVQRVAGGRLSPEEVDGIIRSVLERDSRVRAAFAHAIGSRESSGFETTLLQLSRDPETVVRAEAAYAMGRIRSPEYLAPLLDLLPNEATRGPAQTALAAFGEDGFSAAFARLEDDDATPAVRWHLPRTLVTLDPVSAARELTKRLPNEHDGRVRYRILRSLEVLVRDHPEIELHAESLALATDNAIARAYRSIDRLRILHEGARDDSSREGPGHELLLAIVSGKRDNAVGRLFRLLQLQYPGEDYRRIAKGAESANPETFASSLELIENSLPSPRREAVLGLVDQIDENERLRFGTTYHRPVEQNYDELLRELLSNRSQTLRAAALRVVGELQLADLQEQVESAKSDPELKLDVEWTLGQLSKVRDHADHVG
ncbi:MAG: HEAT repeat domain-containing protein, partial [Myxococcota bacterium]